MSANTGTGRRYCAATGIEALGLLAADGNAARAAFLNELDWVVARLGSTNIELSFVFVDIQGLPTRDVIRCADSLAGNAAFWRPLGDTCFVAVHLTPLRQPDLLERTLIDTLERASMSDGRPVSASIRYLRRWSHDIVDGFYLLQELATQPPQFVAPGLRTAA